MKKTVILFGAGASYGAGDILPEKPPLGSDLFDRLTACAPRTWGALPSPYRDEFVTKGFEEGMELVYEQLSHLIAPLMRDMAVYLIQYRPFSFESAYDHLLEQLSSLSLINSVLFSTLNYDCILEFCLIHRGHKPSYWDEGTNHNTIPVWKLHGSSNWFTSSVKAGSGVSFGRGVTFSGGLEAFLDIGTVVEHCLVNQGLYPAMSLYMKDKPVQIAPEQILRLQSMWKDAVLNAQNVICIGVNPLPADRHIWEPISETDARLFFVGDKNAYDKWISKYRSKPSIYIDCFFDSSVKKLVKGVADELNGSG